MLPADYTDICTLVYSDGTDITVRRFHVKLTVQSKLMTKLRNMYLFCISCK